MICHPARLVFLHVPRTGGMSVCRALERHYGEGSVVWPGGWHATLEEHGKPEDLSGYRIAMFVRNPWDRLVSLAHFVCGRRVPPMWNWLDHLERETGKGSVFLEPRARWWWRPEVSFLGRFESLEEDFARLCKLLDIDRPPVLPHEHETPVRLPFQEYYRDHSEIARVRGLCFWECYNQRYAFARRGGVVSSRHGAADGQRRPLAGPEVGHARVGRDDG